MKSTLEESQLLNAASRDDWRSWLEQHYNSGGEIWLVYYKKHTGKPGISYDDSVLEALCFGWIDNSVRRIDEERYARRFSTRRPKSSYSPDNLLKLKQLIKQGLVADEVLAALRDRGEL